MQVVRAVMAKDRLLSVRMIAEETGLDKMRFIEFQQIVYTCENLCKTSAEKLVCGAKSEPFANLPGFAGKTRNLVRFFGIK